MAKKTRTDQAKLALERLLRDEEIQGHLRTAATQLQEATARARSRRPSKAAEDKKVYRKVRQGAISLNQAARSLRARPEPKRRGRKVAVVAAALAGGAAVALKKRGQPHGAAAG
jgi:uncharacterized membrane protein YjjP (DUF1212 family)